MSHSSTQNAVYLVTVPYDFHPQRPWDFPATIVGAELYEKNLGVTHCLGFARAFNKRQLRLGLPDRKWALVAKGLRFRDQAEPVRGDWEVSTKTAPKHPAEGSSRANPYVLLVPRAPESVEQQPDAHAAVEPAAECQACGRVTWPAAAEPEGAQP